MILERSHGWVEVEGMTELVKLGINKRGFDQVKNMHVSEEGE